MQSRSGPIIARGGGLDSSGFDFGASSNGFGSGSLLRSARERLADYATPDLRASHSRRLLRRGEPPLPRRTVSAGSVGLGGLGGTGTSHASIGYSAHFGASQTQSTGGAGTTGMLASGSTLADHGGLGDRCNTGFVHYKVRPPSVQLSS